MAFSLTKYKLLVLSTVLLGGLACKTAEPVKRGDFTTTDKKAEHITSQMPDYRQTLHSLRGKGKAIVSEPQNTERVTVRFSSNRQKSLIKVKNGLGIEGGQMLTDGDSLLIYNKVDNIARKISIEDERLSRIDNLASINILEMINFTTSLQSVEKVLADEEHYLLHLSSGARIYLDKNTHHVKQVEQPASSRLPYSRIIYEGYSTVNDFMLPRRITIFSADKKSKISFLIQSMEINPDLEPLAIHFPEDTKVYYR